MTSLRVRRLCLDAMLLGAAMILSYLEAVLPLSLLVPLPGAKLGLANVAVMLCFYTVSPVDALAVSVTRVALTSLLFGNVSSFAFAVVGALLAYLGMWLARVFKNKITYYGTSVLCAALHNVGQCCIGALMLKSASIFTYLPLLLVFAVIFGLVTGAVITPLVRIFKNA